MRQNKKARNRLFQYSAISAAFLFSHEKAKADIVYTNLDPDSVAVTGNEFFIDINGDGVNDFEFIVKSSSYYATVFGLPLTAVVRSAQVLPLNGNEIDGMVRTYMSNTYYSAQKIAPGFPIYSGQDFFAGPAQLNFNIEIYDNFYSQIGNWLGVDDSVIGFRINGAEGYYYGWMRLSLSADGDSLTLHDFAYNNTVTDAIYSTVEVTGIVTTLSDKDISLYASGNTIYLSSLQGNLNKGILRVFDDSGKKVFEQPVSGNNTIFSLPGLPSGIYICEFSQGSGKMSKKLFLGL